MPITRPARRAGPSLAGLVVALLVALAGIGDGRAQTAFEGLVEESTRIPAMVRTPNGEQPFGLAAYLVRPIGRGPFPLVLLTHGSPRLAADRGRMRPESAGRQARDFARRGWAAVSVMRRGYGPSDGPYAEDAGRCDRRDYEAAGRASGEDLRGAIRWAAAQPWADARRVLLVGVSAGGFASTALAADPPPGVVAVISFAGGRGSRGPNDVCQSDRLVAAFGAYGRTARAPALWLYAENDQFFGPGLAAAMHAAYRAGGAPVEFIGMAPIGDDGHILYGAGQSRWWPIVDGFLRQNGLPTWSPSVLTLAGTVANGAASSAATVVAGAASANGTNGNGLSPGTERLREAFDRYLAGPGEKAMAVGDTGAFGWATGRNSTREARDDAMEFCRRNTNAQCRLRFVNLEPVP